MFSCIAFDKQQSKYIFVRETSTKQYTQYKRLRVRTTKHGCVGGHHPLHRNLP